MAIDTSQQIDLGGQDLVVRDVFASATAPGQPGKKVLTTDTITPAAGTATLPPIKLSSGTSNTTAQAGAIEYDGSAFYATATASARQTMDTEQWLIAQADITASTGIPSTTAASIFSSGASTLTLAAGQYAFELQLYSTNSQNTSVALTLGFSGTATPIIAYNVTGATSTGGGSSITVFGVDVWQNSTAQVTMTNTSSSATANSIITGYGTMNISAGAAGTFIPAYSCAQNSISSGALVWKAGSFLRVWGIAPASTQSVGRWT